jgi:ATP-binding cassette subfamily A (ABC1) protein 3
VAAAALPALVERLGGASRLAEVRPDGAGWQLARALAGGGAVSVRELAAFWAEEDAVARLRAHLGAAFPGAELIERQGLLLRMRIPPQVGADAPLAAMFAKLEGARRPCGIATYTLSQTTLEMVFNTLAAQQEEEQGVARGVVLGGGVSGGGSSVAAGAGAVGVEDWRLGTRRQ